ncbi:GYDIA family GHMP kinase [Kaistella rhinocerotis]|uniref:GYDIA family GHMP kinase n=1 Tax=Kaistella rhinocerotis TaxID=3026437 RepID=UPI002555E310|nr:GYDIA family GHMP kinase [Kaistella sp. Ran72]
MKGRLFSPGKLLLTSEYTVLDGALALAVPTKWGQELFFEEISDGRSTIHWEAYLQDELWLSTEIRYSDWQITSANLLPAAEFVLKVLKNTARLSSIKFKENTSYRIRTNLQFPANFGLGSSSTLMNNMAEWAGINPYELNEASLGGSGYDIAVAKEKSAVLYQISGQDRRVHKVDFNPVFSDELIFIHLNQKQDSREGIEHYRALPYDPELIEWFSDLTHKVVNTVEIDTFSNLMEAHEQKLSNALLIKTVKERYFSDCPVFVKSLGAWGGDFVMSRKFSGYERYFSERGFSCIYTWSELIL